MAINTSNTILKYAETKEGTFEKLIDITNYPDLGGVPNKLDTTDLTQTKFKTSILGLQEIPDLSFESNYTLENYKKVQGLEGKTLWYQLEFGENGKYGKFQWSGDISVYVSGAGVDEVRKMMTTLSAETPIEEITVGSGE